LIRERTASLPAEIARFLAQGSWRTLLASLELPVRLSLPDLAAWLDAWVDLAEQQDTDSRSDFRETTTGPGRFPVPDRRPKSLSG
jgi:hypothetical protein